MLFKVLIPAVDDHIILQALPLELIKINFQGPGIFPGEPYPFLASRWGRGGRLRIELRRHRHRRFREGKIGPVAGAAAT